MNTYHDPVKMTFRRKGLPKRLKRIPGGVPGLVSACNVHVASDDFPSAKVVFFKNRQAMRRFNWWILPRYRGKVGTRHLGLGRRCAGFVNKLAIEHYNGAGELAGIEVDRNYFCIVCLVVGNLTAEVIAHEAVHVGFAWDYRTRGISPLGKDGGPEENVCYPAGIFVDQVLSFIKAEGLREI